MKFNYLTVLVLSLVSVQGFTQNKTLSDTFRVVKDYQPTLTDAEKITFDPVIDDDLKIDLDLSYSFINKKVPVSFDVQRISPAKIKGEPLVKLYNGYAVLGVGNALLPYGEVYYTNLRSKKYSWGTHAKFINQNKINDIEDSDFNQMHFEVFGKRFWKTNTLEGNINFNRRDFSYYGYNTIARKDPNAAEIPKPNLEQEYSRINGAFSLKSTKRDSFNLRHEGSLEYNFLNNISGYYENNVKVKANLNQFKNSELYNLDVLVDYNSYFYSDDNTIIGLTPKISTIGEKFRIDAGLGFYLNSGSGTDFHFYPIAEIKYNVIDDILVPYVGVKGEIRRVNYNSITLENPFVAEDLDLRNTNEKYNIYAGLRGTLSSKLSFNVRASSIKTDNAYLYVQKADTNSILSKDYYLVYDEIDELQFKGELVYRMNSKLELYALGQYFNYSAKNEAEVWHRPEIKISTSAKYNLKDKIYINLDLIYWGEQFAKGGKIVRTIVPLTESGYFTNRLDPIFDANIGFEYRYTKRLSAFVNFNNIGGINYEKYQNYPTQGFNVLGGFTYGF